MLKKTNIIFVILISAICLTYLANNYELFSTDNLKTKYTELSYSALSEFTSFQRTASKSIKTKNDFPEINDSVQKSVNTGYEAKIIFPWQKKVAAAIFDRAEYFWIIFDRNNEVNVKKIAQKYNKYFSSGEQVKNKHFTILRFKKKNDFFFGTYKKGNNWIIGFSPNKTKVQKPLKIDIKTSKLTGSEIIIKSRSFANMLRIIDPSVGDELVIVPSYDAGVGVNKEYNYADFKLLPIYQGMLVQLKADSIEFTKKENFISLSGPTNRLAAESWRAKELELERKRREELEKKGKQTEKALLKFKTWGGKTTEQSFLEDLNLYKWQITEANWEEKNKFRMQLARFYFTQKLYAETIGILKTIESYDKEYASNLDFKILKGATLHLLHRYQEAIEIFNEINLNNLNIEYQQEVNLWKNASILEQQNLIRMDKYVNTHPLKNTDDSSSDEDQAELTKLILETSSRLLKMIKKLDGDFASSEELQTLEATARFVSSHYKEAIKRFDENNFYKNKDGNKSHDKDITWSLSKNSKANAHVNFLFLENTGHFLKNYPIEIFNEFGLLALSEKISKSDLAGAEDVIASLKESESQEFLNNLKFYQGLLYAKDENEEDAIKKWTELSEEILDRRNRARAQFALTNLLLKKGEINLSEAIERLNSVRMVWRGDIIEMNLLRLLGEFYMDQKKYMKGFKVWREVVTSFPGSEEALQIAKKMSDQFVYLFNGGGADELPQLEALTLYYEFRELTPIGKRGDQMIQRLANRLIEVDLLDKASALLTHQVRFRLIGEEKDTASTKLVKIHMMNNEPQLALDTLKATDHKKISHSLQTERKYLKAEALIDLGKNNRALRLLKGDESYKASFLRSEVYWKNKVWYKVIEELEQPFKEIVREERDLSDSESEQVVRLAVAYALTGEKRRLNNLFEDFIGFVNDERQKDLMQFVALDNGPIHYDNLEKTLELGEIEQFMDKFFNENDNLSSSDKPATK